jgi:hypothetical protein
VINTQNGSIDINGDSILNDRPVLANRSAPLNTFAVLTSAQFSVWIPATTAYSPISLCRRIRRWNGAQLATAHHRQPRSAPFQSRGTGASHLGVLGMDGAVERTFKICESQGLSFRADGFKPPQQRHTGVSNFLLYGTSLLSNRTGLWQGLFANYASTAAGARNLRFFLRARSVFGLPSTRTRGPAKADLLSLGRVLNRGLRPTA